MEKETEGQNNRLGTIMAVLIAMVTVIGAILVWRASVVELYVDAHLAQRGRFLVEEE